MEFKSVQSMFSIGVLERTENPMNWGNDAQKNANSPLRQNISFIFKLFTKYTNT